MLLSILCCGAYADTINLHWLNEDGTTYQDSTCTVDNDLILPATPPTKYGYTFTGWKMASLTQLEYLQSTGKQYIDTKLTVNAGDIMATAVFMPTLFVSGNYACVFGYNGNFQAAYNSNGTANIGNAVSTQIFFELNKKVTVSGILSSNNSQTYYVDSVSTGLSRAFGTGVHLLLFDSTSSNTFPAHGRLYSFKAYRNNNIIMDLIPVLDYGNVPCMYDRVSKQFFYNQGTGQFIAGPVVSEQ